MCTYIHLLLLLCSSGGGKEATRINRGEDGPIQVEKSEGKQTSETGKQANRRQGKTESKTNTWTHDNGTTSLASLSFPLKNSHHMTPAFSIRTLATGLPRMLYVLATFCTTSIPSTTRPKATARPFKCGQAWVEM